MSTEQEKQAALHAILTRAVPYAVLALPLLEHLTRDELLCIALSSVAMAQTMVPGAPSMYVDGNITAGRELLRRTLAESTKTGQS